MKKYIQPLIRWRKIESENLMVLSISVGTQDEIRVHAPDDDVDASEALVRQSTIWDDWNE